MWDGLETAPCSSGLRSEAIFFPLEDIFFLKWTKVQVVTKLDALKPFGNAY